MTNDEKDLPHLGGFATMDRAKHREICSKGGKSAHAQGKAHQWTPEEARAAGRKGGRKVSRDRQHMSEIGALSHSGDRKRR